MKIIYIEWCDAIANPTGWLSVEDAECWAKNEDWIIKQMGFVVKETKQYLLLASRYNPHDKTEQVTRVDGLIKIPKTWIRKQIDLTDFIASF